jgi:hypothetical protein
MGRPIGLTLLIAVVAGVALIVGRSSAPTSLTPAPTSAPPSSLPSVRQAEADAGLDRIVPDLKFDKTPCAEVFDWLHEQTRANIAVNWQALEAEGIDRTTPITLRLTGLPLRRVIELVGEQMGKGEARITSYASRGAIEVSTESKWPRTTVVRIYDVRDIVNAEVEARWQIDHPRAVTTQPPGGGNVCFPATERTESLDGIYEAVYTELGELIQENLSPEMWREAGGDVGSLRCFGGRLIIAATPRMHAEVEALLAMVRSGNGEVRVR